jgi:hypothetical protein
MLEILAGYFSVQELQTRMQHLVRGKRGKRAGW